jgi:hypothetical protein
MKAERIVEAVDDVTGLGPGPSFDLILDHARPWVTPLLLIDFQGNIGSPDDGPAAPRYIEARLSPAGRLVCDTEAGRLAPIPVALITGNCHRGGVRPPLDPLRVITTLLRPVAEPDVGDEKLIDMVGPPVFPTAGVPCPVTLRARIRPVADNPRRVDIEYFPPGVGVSEVIDAISPSSRQRPWASTHPHLARHVENPFDDVMNISAQRHQRVRATARPGATDLDVERFLRQAWPLGINHMLQYPEPLADLLRNWVAGASGENLSLSLNKLATTI